MLGTVVGARDIGLGFSSVSRVSGRKVKAEVGDSAVASAVWGHCRLHFVLEVGIVTVQFDQFPCTAADCSGPYSSVLQWALPHGLCPPLECCVFLWLVLHAV